MSEKTREVPQLADTTYAHTLVYKGTHEYKVHGPYGSWKVGTIWPMDLVFMSTFDNQSMSIGCIGKLGHLSGFLRHYLLITERTFHRIWPSLVQNMENICGPILSLLISFTHASWNSIGHQFKSHVTNVLLLYTKIVLLYHICTHTIFIQVYLYY